jgi:DNA-binding beta-propeller fold protein YncE
VIQTLDTVSYCFLRISQHVSVMCIKQFILFFTVYSICFLGCNSSSTESGDVSTNEDAAPVGGDLDFDLNIGPPDLTEDIVPDLRADEGDAGDAQVIDASSDVPTSETVEQDQATEDVPPTIDLVVEVLEDISGDLMPDQSGDLTVTDVSPDAEDSVATDLVDDGEVSTAPELPEICDDLPPLPTDFINWNGPVSGEDFAFSADGFLISNDTNGNIMRSTRTGPVGIIVPDLIREAAGIAFLPDGQLMLAGVDEGVLYRIDTDTGSSEIVLGGLSYPNGVATDHDGWAYVAEHDRGTVRQVDPYTGDFTMIASGLTNPNGIAFDIDYKRLFVGSFGDGTVHAIPFNDDGTFGPHYVYGTTPIFNYGRPDLPILADDICTGLEVGSACIEDTTLGHYEGACSEGPIVGIEEEVFSLGSEWAYFDEDNIPGEDWFMPEFDDSSWEVGPSPLGYGDSYIETEVDYGPDDDNKYITTYFRSVFTLGALDDVISAEIGIMLDDGAVLYVNGEEMLRINMPVGEITHETEATSVMDPPDESEIGTYVIDYTLFQEGDNWMAVEVHQGDESSSDKALDLSLTIISPDTSIEDPLEVTLTCEPDGLLSCEGLELGSPCLLNYFGFPAAGYCQTRVAGIECVVDWGGNWNNGGLDGIGVDICGNVYVTEYVVGLVWRIGREGSSLGLVAATGNDWIPNVNWGTGTEDWPSDSLFIIERSREGIFELLLGVPGNPLPYP